MTKNRIFKIIIITLIMFALIIMFTQNSFALSYNISDKFSGIYDRSNATNKVTDVFGTTINFLQVFGLGFALLMLVILGIRWIGSSPSGKADIARQSKYYILGAIFIISGVALISIIRLFTVKSFVSQNLISK